MGIFKRDRAGWNCRDNQDGTTTCIRFEADDKNQKVSTGTEITITINPHTCQPYFSGDVSILDSDEKKIDSIVKKKTMSCRKGL